MKLTKEQQEEIKNQQSQESKTKRVTVPELEKGFVRGLASFRSWVCKGR